MAFSVFTRNIRKNLGLTQQELANRLGVNRSAVRQFEADIIHMPSNRVLSAFCDLLSLDPLTVMTYILFDSNDYSTMHNWKEQVGGNISYRYCAYLVLNGWNFDSGVQLYRINEGAIRRITATVSKKRESDKKIMINSIESYISGTYITTAQMIEIFGSTLGYILCSQDIKYKGYHLVFNSKINLEVQLFNKYKTIVTEKLNYDYQFVLFDPEKGKIQDSFSIKNYKRK
ncbi:helix-turn-helix domain-containing protein [Holdemanella biformis]|jgi:transcriptional regulator with XRE-family HTH domain|uniref:helix-turn-helix domain-containing protein n=1 Tax=Holdemanella biformis TaxID=1735 RepID=UPI0024932D2F|nr:helix-turn-helix transcriptional regulator [Holdemanella biformis]